jgi:hypothetical protein
MRPGSAVWFVVLVLILATLVEADGGDASGLRYFAIKT